MNLTTLWNQRSQPMLAMNDLTIAPLLKKNNYHNHHISMMLLFYVSLGVALPQLRTGGVGVSDFGDKFSGRMGCGCWKLLNGMVMPWFMLPCACAALIPALVYSFGMFRRFLNHVLILLVVSFDFPYLEEPSIHRRNKTTWWCILLCSEYDCPQLTWMFHQSFDFAMIDTHVYSGVLYTMFTYTVSRVYIYTILRPYRYP